jgi:bifunctional DNA-binding transcriptional regulator/antitoxin component of YhaV-PrlF toxin-antitoxin module
MCDLQVAELADELVLGITVLNSGGRTIVPNKVMELLKLRYTPQRRQKLLWIQEDGDVVVEKGTLQSSFRKTILSRGGKTAVPKHAREVLKLKSTPDGEERLIWIQRGDDIIVRRGTPQSRTTN